MRRATAAAIAAAGIAAGSLAVAAVNPFGIAAAQDSGSTPTVQTPGKSGSNEDPTHEATESPERENAEDSGQHLGGGRHFRGGSNEDATHEGKESAEREAQEDAGGATRPAPAQPSTAQ